MSPPSFPVKIQLIIIDEVFKPQEDVISISHQNDCLVHQARRAQRLARFHSLA
jgi:hypothetical protein